jgi:hypothetical protein
MGDFLYIITSPLVKGVKIGKTSDWSKLRSRYRTSYGENIIMYVFECDDRHKEEKQLHCYFAEHRKSGEIFDKKYIKMYIVHCVKIYNLIFAFDYSKGSINATNVDKTSNTPKLVTKKSTKDYTDLNSPIYEYIQTYLKEEEGVELKGTDLIDHYKMINPSDKDKIPRILYAEFRKYLKEKKDHNAQIFVGVRFRTEKDD